MQLLSSFGDHRPSVDQFLIASLCLSVHQHTRGCAGATCALIRALCEFVLLLCFESVLLFCSNSPSWPSRSRGRVSVVTHTTCIQLRVCVAILLELCELAKPVEMPRASLLERAHYPSIPLPAVLVKLPDLCCNTLSIGASSPRPPLTVEPRVLCSAHCARLCCFSASSQCCCSARTHRAGRALSLL